MPALPRLLPALVTPFDRAGELDLDAHRHNLAHLSEVGIRGFLLGGSTGEGPLLEPDERAALTVAARKILGRRAYLMVGVVAESVHQASRQIETAAEAGADSALVLTPTTLARTSLAAQIRFYRAVADAAPLPVLLYSVPRNTGYALAEEGVTELASHPNIIGMKDSGGDAVRISRLAGLDSEFMLFNGAAASVTLSLAGGAYGAITASTNYLPEAMIRLVATARRSPIRARPLQQAVGQAAQVIEAAGIGGVKTASTLAGLRPGAPRPPLAPAPTGWLRRQGVAARLETANRCAVDS